MGKTVRHFSGSERHSLLLGRAVFSRLALLLSLCLIVLVAGCTRRADYQPHSTIVRVWATPAHPSPGQDLVLHARIINKDGVPVPAGTVIRVAFGIDGHELGKVDFQSSEVTPNAMVDVLSAGKNVTGALACSAVAGRHFVVAALADPEGPRDDAFVFVQSAAAGLVVVGPPSTDRRLRIMALGDSITGGTKSSTSFRYFLSKSLTQSGFSAFAFVGSLTGIADGLPPPDTDWEMRHEGHPGWTAEEIVTGTHDRRAWAAGKLAGIGGWANVYQPEVVMIDLGLNDLSEGKSPKRAIASIGQAIDALRRANPQVAIALAQVTPEWAGEPGSRNVPELNERIELLALKKTTLASPIVVVDLHSDIDTAQDLIDGVHPTDDCHRKLADRWLPAIEYLSRIVTARRPASGLIVAMDEQGKVE